MNTALILVLLTLGMAFFDRLIGWGGYGRTKPVIASIIFLAGIGYALDFPVLAWATLPVAFLIWRTPGWKTLGGSLAPVNKSEVFGTFRRHLLALGFVFPLYWAGFNVVPTIICMIIFALCATGLGILNAIWFAKGKDHNEWIEAVRGLSLGCLLSISILI